MPRPRRATAVVAAMLAAALWILLPRARAARSRNVLLVVVDTLRADHLGCYGYAPPTSPFVDALADESVLFEFTTSTASQTVPAVLSVWTGLYPSRHGNQYFPSTSSFRIRRRGVAPKMPEGVETMAERFRASGFKTGAVVSNPWLDPRYGFARGFDVYDHLLSERKPKSLADLRSGALYVRSGAVNARAVALLRRWKDERFFLYVHYMDVHSPYAPPEPYRTRFAAGKEGRYVFRTGPVADAAPADVAYTQALYDAEIRALDDALRSLLDELAALGLASSTTVVLTGDHGEEFLEHGGMGHGTTLYRELTRVPLIVRHPGGAAGKRVHVPVSLADLWPTLADLTGTEAPATEGVSLADLIDGRSDAPPRPRRVVFSEIGPMRSARRGPYILIREIEPRVSRAFDLRTDPREQHPLVGDPEWRRSLRAALDRFLAQVPSPQHAGEYEEIDPADAERLRALGYGS